MSSTSSFALRAGLALAAVLGLAAVAPCHAQIVQVGAGSYTTALPAGASAPQSTVYKTYAGPVATHKWWTAKNWNPNDYVNGGPYVMYPEPLNVQASPGGLVVGACPSVANNGTWFFRAPEADLTLGVAGLNNSTINISAYTDWTVDFNFGPMATRLGRGMPFVYATTDGSNPTVTFAATPTVFANNGNVIGVTVNGNNYGLFGPAGSTWTGLSGTTFTCNLPSGHAYVSLAILPSQTALSDYALYAFSFPTNTQVAWTYNPSTSQVTTTYTVTTQAMEGSETGFLMALYPHQYGSLSGSINTPYTYASARGTMEVYRGTSFSTVDTYHGVLPYLPPTGNYNPTTLQGYLDTVTNEGNHFTGGDTYSVGLENARIAHLLPIAKSLNTTQANADFSALLSSLESNLSNWFTATSGKTADLFYYDPTWGTLIGYPAGYGSDTSINDHHFHYGYWIHSAALIGLYDPTWLSSSQWGGMVSLLARDIADPVRGDGMFPFMRYFDVYGGHSWASGQAPFLDGGNEESSSEAVNAWVGLIVYAQETNNTQLRDAAIWLYTQETKAVRYYWFNDAAIKTFPSGFARTEVANVFDDKSDTGTWFGGQIEYEHGIEFLPFTGGSAYLGRDEAYCQANWAEILQYEGVSTFNPATALWPDLMEEYEAFFNPTDAINNWNQNPANSTFDGETQAHEYYWLHNMQALGNVDYNVTADTPLFSVYRNPSTGVVTHIAYNASAAPISVTFSDGVSFTVPANSMQSDTSAATLPAAPSGLAATAASASQVNLSWNASATSGVTYSVFRGTTSGFTPSAATQVASGLTGTGDSDGGLSSGTTYYYVVEAVNSAGSSAPSNEASATTQTVVSLPAAPTGLSATTASTSRINLAWTASATGGVTYSVFRGTSSGFTASAATQVASGISGTSASDTGLAAGTTYYYLVEAVDSAGTSAPSNQASATTSQTVTSGGNTLYLLAGATASAPGALSLTAGASASSDTVPADDGGTYDGTPHAPLTYLITGVSGTYSGGATQFNLYVDSQTAVGNGVQVQVLYDFNGDGTWDRVETYHYFPTDPVVGWEDYTQNQGLESSSGSFANLNNGRIEIQVWNAIGSNPSYVSTASPSASQSALVLPFSGVSTGVVPPSAPSGLSASAASTSQVNLGWTASATNGVSYAVFRSTTSGFAASASTQVASGVTGTSYSDTGLAAGTTYYYLVQAVDSSGSSGSSNQASATTQTQTTTGGAVYISAGGPAAGSFVADTDYSGGTAAAFSTTAIDTSLVPNPPPLSVLQHERYGPMTYTIPGLTPGKAYTVNLVFVELYWTAAGQRQFNVLINGTQVLGNFDIIANAGAANKAIQESFSATATASGQVVIQFTTGSADLPKVDAVEVF